MNDDKFNFKPGALGTCGLVAYKAVPKDDDRVTAGVTVHCFYGSDILFSDLSSFFYSL